LLLEVRDAAGGLAGGLGVGVGREPRPEGGDCGAGTAAAAAASAAVARRRRRRRRGVVRLGEPRRGSVTCPLGSRRPRCLRPDLGGLDRELGLEPADLPRELELLPLL